MPYIHYQYDPNDPEGREKAASSATTHVSAVLLSVCFFLMAVLSYLTALAVALKSGTYVDCISTFLLCLFTGVIHFFALHMGETKAAKKQAVKGYFLKLIGALLVLSGLLVMNQSFSLFSHGENGWPLLLCSGLLTIMVILVCVVLYRRLKGLPVSLRLFSSKDISSPPAEAPVLAKPTAPTPAPEASCIFCHHCGKKLPSDSTFCSACGAKLKM